MKEEGAGNVAEYYNQHHWHLLAQKQSRQSSWMVLLYTIMILFLRGKGDLFHFDPLLYVAPKLSTSG